MIKSPIAFFIAWAFLTFFVYALLEERAGEEATRTPKSVLLARSGLLWAPAVMFWFLLAAGEIL